MHDQRYCCLWPLRLADLRRHKSLVTQSNRALQIRNHVAVSLLHRRRKAPVHQFAGWIQVGTVEQPAGPSEVSPVAGAGLGWGSLRVDSACVTQRSRRRPRYADMGPSGLGGTGPPGIEAGLRFGAARVSIECER